MTTNPHELLHLKDGTAVCACGWTTTAVNTENAHEAHQSHLDDVYDTQQFSVTDTEMFRSTLGDVIAARSMSSDAA